MFTICKRDTDTNARTGVLSTNHGEIETPAYTVVGTHARVKTLDNKEVIDAATQGVIVNTYHMWRDLGDDGLGTFKGLHSEMGWDIPLMTDSGGYQVFSLRFPRKDGIGKIIKNKDALNIKLHEKDSMRITRDGVFFKIDGIEEYLDAERSIAIQEKLGADIMFAFDECTSPLHDVIYTRRAMNRTHRWAVRSLRAHTTNQLLYGIVQGGLHKVLRETSARYIGKMDFDGFGIGGAFGRTLGAWDMDAFQELTWAIPYLPEHKPRHLLGVGRPEDVFKAVASGVDTFDCTVPTREARHGTVWTGYGRINITKPRYASDNSLLEEGCTCVVCAEKQITKSELRGLFKDKDTRAGRFASIHNIYFFNSLMSQIRSAINNGTYRELWRKYKQHMDK